MSHPSIRITTQSCALAVVLIATGGGCDGEATQEKTAASVIALALTPVHAPLERPEVLFDHDAHTRLLVSQGCGTCHPKGDEGGFVFTFARSADPPQREALIDLYHDACMGCHLERRSTTQETGPTMCGACHQERAPIASARVKARFDYSLHARHVKGEGGKCDGCHHVYNEAERKLEYKKGAEGGCSECHTQEDQGRTLSLQRASHRACVGCHIERAGRGQDSGPQSCDGCHAAEKLAGIEKLNDIPRLERGQRDMTWVSGVAANLGMVPFDHQLHEPRAAFCSTCHHQTMAACSECHTAAGGAKGGGVTLAAAQHLATSERSCVGCHEKQASAPRCRGCHEALPAGASQQSCTVCHSGPEAVADRSALPVAEPAVLELAPLPEYSEAFPAIVVIDSMVHDYAASKLPHGKIVAALDGGVRDSKLAQRFHGRTEMLCSGCHHHTPAGVRPPPCRSCHSLAGDAGADKPGLKAAYHRQCVACHREMNQPTGCVDCHAEASREVQP